MSANASIEFEYIVQKWLGSLYSLGLSQQTVTQIATGLNALGTGDVDWLDIQVVMEQYLDVLNQQVLIHINKEDNKLALDKRKR